MYSLAHDHIILKCLPDQAGLFNCLIYQNNIYTIFIEFIYMLSLNLQINTSFECNSPWIYLSTCCIPSSYIISYLHLIILGRIQRQIPSSRVRLLVYTSVVDASLCENKALAFLFSSSTLPPSPHTQNYCIIMYLYPTNLELQQNSLLFPNKKKKWRMILLLLLSKC